MCKCVLVCYDDSFDLDVGMEFFILSYYIFFSLHRSIWGLPGHEINSIDGNRLYHIHIFLAFRRCE